MQSLSCESRLSVSAATASIFLIESPELRLAWWSLVTTGNIVWFGAVGSFNARLFLRVPLDSEDLRKRKVFLLFFLYKLTPLFTSKFACSWFQEGISYFNNVLANSSNLLFGVLGANSVNCWRILFWSKFLSKCLFFKSDETF